MSKLATIAYACLWAGGILASIFSASWAVILAAVGMAALVIWSAKRLKRSRDSRA